jgi:plasmid maintenance system antidote protein VapI
MAIRIEKAFGPDMETLMRMQNSFDIAAAQRNKAGIAVRRYAPRPARHGRASASN